MRCSKVNYQRRLTARSGAAHSINCGHLLGCRVAKGTAGIEPTAGVAGLEPSLLGALPFLIVIGATITLDSALLNASVLGSRP
jgi:hypothetical protein